MSAPHNTLTAYSVARRPLRERALQAGRFFLHVLEMAIPMMLGMVGFGLLVDQLRPIAGLRAAVRSGSDLSILGDAMFMSLPMVAWMLLRGHDRRHSLEMAASMIVTGVAIVALGWLGADPYAPWLRAEACMWMCLGMPIYMLARYDHFSAKTPHLAHAGHVGH